MVRVQKVNNGEANKVTVQGELEDKHLTAAKSASKHNAHLRLSVKIISHKLPKTIFSMLS
jgi:hypothetical protein